MIVDNGRSRLLADRTHRRALACIRCGACMNTCPVYRRSGGHSYGATVPGPIGSILEPARDPGAPREPAVRVQPVRVVHRRVPGADRSAPPAARVARRARCARGTPGARAAGCSRPRARCCGSPRATAAAASLARAAQRSLPERWLDSRGRRAGRASARCPSCRARASAPSGGSGVGASRDAILAALAATRAEPAADRRLRGDAACRSPISSRRSATRSARPAARSSTFPDRAALDRALAARRSRHGRDRGRPRGGRERRGLVGAARRGRAPRGVPRRARDPRGRARSSSSAISTPPISRSTPPPHTTAASSRARRRPPTSSRRS